MTAKLHITSDSALKFNPNPSVVFFGDTTKEILRIDQDGVVYMGNRVKDAGEAYDAIMSALNKINTP